MPLLFRKKKSAAANGASPSSTTSIESSTPAEVRALASTEVPLDAPRVLIIGAGSRGNAYAHPIHATGAAHIVAVAEPIAHKRDAFGKRFIWGPDGSASEGQSFADWREWIQYEVARREKVKKAISDGSRVDADDTTEKQAVSIAFVCVLDEQHGEVVKALAPLGIHIMCEKPLATTMDDCLDIYGSMLKAWAELGRKTVFGIGHVLRYAPHNVLLRKLVREDGVVGEVMSVEHTEPVGWWHFAHSYVR
jgi:predicted dehydrogenase